MPTATACLGCTLLYGAFDAPLVHAQLQRALGVDVHARIATRIADSFLLQGGAEIPSLNTGNALQAWRVVIPATHFMLANNILVGTWSTLVTMRDWATQLLRWMRAKDGWSEPLARLPRPEVNTPFVRSLRSTQDALKMAAAMAENEVNDTMRAVVERCWKTLRKCRGVLFHGLSRGQDEPSWRRVRPAAALVFLFACIRCAGLAKAGDMLHNPTAFRDMMRGVLMRLRRRTGEERADWGDGMRSGPEDEGYAQDDPGNGWEGGDGDDGGREREDVEQIDRCTAVLARYKLTDRRAYVKWLRVYHPDKWVRHGKFADLDDREKAKLMNDVKAVIECAGVAHPQWASK